MLPDVTLDGAATEEMKEKVGATGEMWKAVIGEE